MKSGNLKDIQKNWEEFAKSDPLFSILTDPQKRDNRWNPDEFFDVGKKQISDLMYKIQDLDIVPKPGKALDFGCAVGRVTEPLSDYFDECIGVDISPTMISLAKEFHPDSKCEYMQFSDEDLNIFDDEEFDFVYSTLVLQHMKPELSSKYLKEFSRVLKQGGILVFQLPSDKIALKEFFMFEAPYMEMHFVSVKKVREILSDLELIAMDTNSSCDDPFVSTTYFFKKS